MTLMNQYVPYNYWESSAEEKVCEFCESGTICECFLALFNLGQNFYTVYVVYLAVILIWRFGEFLLVRQI